MKRLTNLIILSSLLLTAHSVFAERHIHVNGQCLEQAQMAQLDQLIGGQAPDGFYWIDFKNGAWGYEGNEETQGYITAIVSRQDEQSGSASSSDDGGNRPYINSSNNGRVVSGKINGQNCTYVSVGGTAVRSCD
jgi:hypothetical protein